jgi:hypothetical protein
LIFQNICGFAARCAEVAKPFRGGCAIILGYAPALRDRVAATPANSLIPRSASETCFTVSLSCKQTFERSIPQTLQPPWFLNLHRLGRVGQKFLPIEVGDAPNSWLLEPQI